MRSAGTVSGFLAESIESTRSITQPILRVSIGNTVFDIQTCCAAVGEALRGHVGHLEVSVPSQRTIVIVDSEHIDAHVPSMSWKWSSTTYRDDSGIAYFLDYYKAIFASDQQKSKYVLATRSFGPQDFSRREVVRLLLQPILSSEGLDVIHGASVGDHNRAVLLAGPGGSGKSTLVAASVRHGFYTVGEDFLVLNVNERNPDKVFVYSLFRSGKLVSSGPEADEFIPVSRSEDEKNVVFLDQLRPAVVLAQEVVATATIRRGLLSSILPGKWTDFATALLPYSAPLTFEPMRMTSYVNNFLREKPTYDVISGPDIRNTLGLIERLLSE